MPKRRYICIHGHFYQPPRENPWLDAVELQDSAAPFHDWNERITRECYAPNIRARLLDGQGQIVNILNNYAWISFNFGPTLLQWMSEREPKVLEGIVEADRLSAQRRNGHGNALAQVYNHIILPLASFRDKQTQVRWGIADFRARFGRDPEGMWLAETAVDVESLEVLAEAGIAFTILAPRQARRWRKLGDKAWQEIPDGVDPSRAYLCNLPSGRSISLFFYDGIISQQVAFERLLDDGDRFLSRLNNGFDDRREHAQLMHIATDGESYGHHHPHGDMALAYVLQKLARDPNVRLTNYGEFLALHPPAWEVEIHENSSWSCAHGVERWRSDCDCRMRSDWNQQWREPLRRAFDALKDDLDDLFVDRGAECFADPWAARDAYIDVMLKPGDEEAQRRFLSRHGLPDLGPSGMIAALRLLEIQRDALFMFTSCGWFFDEVSGMETIQCLTYAARAIHLARLFDRDFESKFLEIFSDATSNLPRYKDGRTIWEQLVRPAHVDIERVLAHRAISMIYPVDNEHGDASTRAFELSTIDQEIRSRGNGHLAVGRIKARSRRTWEEGETSFVVIHFGGLDFHAILSTGQSLADYETFKRLILSTYRAGSLADVTNLVARGFAGNVHRLDDLFKDEQRRIIGIVLEDRFETYQRVFEHLANQDEEALNRLGRLNCPVPKVLLSAASAYLDSQLMNALDRLGNGEDNNLESLVNLWERGKSWDYRADRPVMEAKIGDAIELALNQLMPGADLAAISGRVGLLLDAIALMGLSPDLWRSQNALLNAHGQYAPIDDQEPHHRELFIRLALGLRVKPSLLGWKP